MLYKDAILSAKSLLHPIRDVSRLIRGINFRHELLAGKGRKLVFDRQQMDAAKRLLMEHGRDVDKLGFRIAAVQSRPIKYYTPLYKTNKDLYEHFVDPNVTWDYGGKGHHIWTSPAWMKPIRLASRGKFQAYPIRETYKGDAMQRYKGRVILNDDQDLCKDSPTGLYQQLRKLFPKTVFYMTSDNMTVHNGDRAVRIALSRLQGMDKAIPRDKNNIEAVADTGKRLLQNRVAIETGPFTFTHGGRSIRTVTGQTRGVRPVTTMDVETMGGTLNKLDNAVAKWLGKMHNGNYVVPTRIQQRFQWLLS